jgi:hypothetical protein
MTDRNDLPIVLSDKKWSLVDALYRRSERLAQMYVGALIAWEDSRNPERFVLVAHELNELMEKIPWIVDVPTPAHSEHMGNKVAEIERRYGVAIASSSVKPPTWNGTVDPPISDLLDAVRDFLEWKKTHRLRRGQEIVSTFRALDGPVANFPSDLEDQAVRLWSNIKDFFESVKHHRKTPEGTQMEDALQRLETFLLRKLNPPTFADFDNIDAIIAAGENDDQQ